MNDERTERSRTLMRVGAFSALIWVALQIVGNALHPRLPQDAVGSMTHIAHSSVWFVAHVILLFDYIVLIPLVVGFAAAFAAKPWTIQLAVPLMVVAVTVGIAQVALHPTTLHVLAGQYAAAGSGGDAGAQSSIVALYDAFWSYNIVMEIGHLLVIHLVVVLIAVAMLREPLFPRWLGWLGIIGGVAAASALIVGEVVLDSSVLGDIVTFGIGLLPSAVWLVAVAVVLLRVTPGRLAAAAPRGGAA
jgi:hypothetical protein